LLLVRAGEGNMSKGRLEAFSDGVLALIITIRVLEMKSPRGTSLAAYSL
jgi:TMEM175 potassium channel family protein